MMTDLLDQLEKLKSQQVVEDYFHVNEEPIDIFPRQMNTLYQFCSDGENKVIDMSAQVTMEDDSNRVALSFVKVEDNQMTILSQSSMDDSQSPTSMSLIYRGRVEKPCQFYLMITTLTEMEKDTIKPRRLQFGYKMYGAGYPLIDSLDDKCFAAAPEI